MQTASQPATHRRKLRSATQSDHRLCIAPLTHVNKRSSRLQRLIMYTTHPRLFMGVDFGTSGARVTVIDGEKY